MSIQLLRGIYEEFNQHPVASTNFLFGELFTAEPAVHFMLRNIMICWILAVST